MQEKKNESIVREEVLSFAFDMERTLRRNHKDGWSELGIYTLMYRIKGEYEEMLQEFKLYTHSETINKKEHVKRIREEALDIAAYCMFLCLNYTDEGEGR
jgi:NTP pyrophosphatase (non-canonical NTP hydrolase)